MKHSTEPPTRAEQRRFEEMMSLGCVACAHLGIWVVAQEAHHILRGGVRLGHIYSLPLCKGHHKGEWPLAQQLCILPEKRISIADGRKRFTSVYPDEKNLWEQVQKRLHLPTDWPESKVRYEQPD